MLLLLTFLLQDKADLPSRVESWSKVTQGDLHVGYLEERLERSGSGRGFRHTQMLWTAELLRREEEEVEHLRVLPERVHRNVTLLMYALRQSDLLDRPGRIAARVRSLRLPNEDVDVVLDVGETVRREYFSGRHRVTPVSFAKAPPAERPEFEMTRAWIDRYGRIVESELRCGARITLVAGREEAMDGLSLAEYCCWSGSRPRQEGALPAPTATSWGRIEWKESAALLHVEAWPADGKIAMPRLNNPIGAVYVQGDQAQKAVGFQPNVADWAVSRPKDAGPSVIVVETLGKPRVAGEAPPVVEAGKDGSVTLAAHDAACRGRLLRYEPQPHKNTVGTWADEKDWVEWRFRAKAGTYKVLLLQGCGKGQGGSAIQVSVGGRKLDFTVEDTGHFQNFVERPAGSVALGKDGEAALEIRALKKAKGAVMDVRQVRLVPE